MKKNIKILLIDDEPNSTQFLRKALIKKGFDIVEENDSLRAKELILENYFDIIISDLQMPGISGLELLKVKPKNTLFIMITGYGSVNSAVESMKLGAFDYVNKPFNLEEFLMKVDKAADKIMMTNEIRSLKTLVHSKQPYSNIIGTSKRMSEVYDFIDRTSKVNVNILINGQSGTGKELVARAIHLSGERKNESFIAINCSAIPENLLESELFGHVKGAFTGATENQKGVFEQADNGTLFLDEIAEMPYQLQAKLLRVLETWEIKPIGSDKIKKIDVRLISATNQNLSEFISAKAFREDLYYRISTVSIMLPSLNERASDIPALTNYYLNILSQKFRKKLRITPEALNLLMQHNYKGNVRELENILEQAAITTTNDLIEINHFAFPKSFRQDQNILNDCLNRADNISLKNLEKIYIKKILDGVNGNKSKASEILGIDRKTLYNKISEYNLQ
ncbi:MAG: sigma-54 dependent transcriptional regulator [Ignavibacteriae bacterium]|nr:sigma-54 dependent transcriptional regulator [Ignavibacteriota bacterium]